MKKTLPIVIGLVLVCGLGGYVIKSKAPATGPAGAAGDDKAPKVATVSRGDIALSVLETGTVDANKVVEVKGRVTGRLAKLLVDEGDHVTAGQLIAVIDPKETQLVVDQNAAQLRGAESTVARSQIEIAQRRVTAKASYEQAKAKVAQLQLEMRAQPTVTRSNIIAAQTNLATAVAERDRLANSANPTQRRASESALAEAKANYDNAELQYKRQSELLNKGYVSGRTVDSMKLDMDLAKVRLETAQQNLDRLDSQLQAELAKANEAVEQAQSSLRMAKANAYAPESKRQDYLTAVAEMEKARAALQDPDALEKQRETGQATVSQLQSVLNDSRRQLSETEIRAPISGVVTKKLIQVGELATGLSTFSSGSTIVKIEDRSGMRVKLDMNEIDMAKLQLGMTANVDVDAIPEKSYHGVIAKIAPSSKDSGNSSSSSDSVVKYEVEIQLTDADAKLRTGMSAKCSVQVLSHKNVLTLPIEYVTREGKKAYVDLPSATKGGKPEHREVTVGAETGATIEIVSGLKEGDKVQKPNYNGPPRKGFMQAGPDGE